MIEVATPAGQRIISAISARTPDGDRIIASVKVTTVAGDRTVYTAGGGGGSIAATISPLQVDGYAARNKPTNIETEQVAAAVTGGREPYTYAWAQTAGESGWQIGSPAGALTRFYAVVPAASTKSATFTVTITDARGNTATASATAVAENMGV